MSKVIVIGAGPAGMMAAITAAKEHKVTLLDGNERLGKKLFITGKGRCNVTNAKDISEFFDYIPGNPHFLYSALYTFTNEDTMNFFSNEGIKLKVERGDRVFPESDKSSDIIRGLSNALSRTDVEIKLNSKVTNIKYKNNSITGIEINNDEILKADHYIIATGGASYPLTGSRGEGQEFSKKLGHKIIPLKPALVPMVVKDAKTKELMGLSLKNVEVTIKENDKKVVYKNFGEMLFTHFGVSGPLILSGSRFIENNKNYKLHIDLKPSLNLGELDKRIQRDFNKYLNKDFKNSLNELLPQKLIPMIIEMSNIPEEKKVNEITKEERRNLVNILKDFSFDLNGLRPLAEGIVTKGGIDVKEIDPSTMKSKIIDNLSFCGEVMDVDAFTGGYNVQIAFATGVIAGSHIE
ncbi:NAD(P)/FAD-dependent oxidoreductase [Clostridium botulinum]|uniref:Pyridine nucleotide-disulphide oxidoreductase family protein n=1 Tax=Clostridium botulinum (strain Eklund 17B / Type B) TaxID=935198 RepID=B2TIA3_CLOBB|nr:MULTISPECIES: NAD(P)/FAD-dependent oxidoreductase [Clostridium]ACD23735.1 pyridine nucleotide-disulphide oxidoreductase family protein [Clostridium botulinum B str. Eklund 17B (NRP)]MBN1038630.1 NAD(P)/FAD-dependent oxidoreductase [Clostridium botulinum]MBN1052152.1 NAD(P)/FAD-dependent oxidoreductase [Clostridium botulinum]MBN1055347.1 NAD(P)/FAD-dependent oxidoreductase [Clostridium botulinum]MBY6977236.1 NAD(P)/FAD-dependent oxidoreductase [Clostridium botulinum]